MASTATLVAINAFSFVKIKIIPSAVQQKGWKQQMTTQQGCAFVFPLLVARNASSLSER